MDMRGVSFWRCLCAAAIVASFALLILPVAEAQASNRSKVDNVVGEEDRTMELGPSRNSDDEPLRAAYPRSNYTWPFETGPRYGQLDRSSLNREDVVLTRVGSFRLADVASGAIRLPGQLRANKNLAHGRHQYFIVQYDPSITGWVPTASEAIEANGGKVIGGMRNAAVLTRLNHGAYRAVETLPGVQLIEPYHPAFKLSPKIGRVPLRDRNKAISEVYDLEVILFEGEDAQLAAQEISSAGGTVLKRHGRTLVVRMHRNKLDRVASLDAVQAVNEALISQPFGEETTLTIQQGDATPRIPAGGPYHDSGVRGGGSGVAGVCIGTAIACDDHEDCGASLNDGLAEGNLCTTGRQVIMILDSGIQLDAADMADTNSTPGSASVAHRKVRKYEPTTQFGGLGDDTGCDNPAQGGTTHGHTVAATAAGWATNFLPASFGDADSDGVGDPIRVEEIVAPGNFWDVDGVAPEAHVVAYDAQVQPPPGESCGDPEFGVIDEGDIYSGPASAAVGSGSLGVSYFSDGARIFNFSWGANQNVYSSNALKVDQFLNDNADAMVFIAAGNSSIDADNDGIPDAGTLGTPATTKNGLAIGASDNGTAGQGPTTSSSRAGFSSVGPAAASNGCTCDPSNAEVLPCGTECRIAPQLMAPGNEFAGGNLGIASEFHCRSNDNGQGGMVECDLDQAKEGTSFASPAAAGAGLLVRDYFAQGYYPSGDSLTGVPFPNVSGALVKAVLLASAEFMNGGSTLSGTVLPFRGNNLQGWGRIELDNALPLAGVNPIVTGLVVTDGAIAGGPNNLGLGGAVDTDSAVGSGCDDNAWCDTGTFRLCDAEQTLRVALTWIDPIDGGLAGDLVNNLNLEVESPTGKLYIGNYFTEDETRDRLLDTTGGDTSTGIEDCVDAGNVLNSNVGLLDQSPFSLRVDTCTQGNGSIAGFHVGGAGVPRDDANPIEVIALTPDLDGDGGFEVGDPDTDGADDSQLAGEEGEWTIRVYKGAGTGSGTPQSYAVAVTGGVCLGSSVSLDKSLYVCNEELSAKVFETPTLPSEAVVGANVTFKVLDSNGTEVDSESAFSFTQVAGGLPAYDGEFVQLSPGTGRDPGNGALDVLDGDRIVVEYTDVDAGSVVRRSSAVVNCQIDVAQGAITFGVFGRDGGFLVNGGCERNARGLFEFGFPDKYMDEGENIVFNFAFGSDETEDLHNLVASLRCVQTDGNSTPDCLPGGGGGCTDPERSDNTACDDSWLSITNSPITIGLLPASSTISANFNIEMGDSIPTGQPVELVLELTGAVSGKTGKSVVISPQTLNVDELSTYYHTDFPFGGIELMDMNNNETIEGCRGDTTAGDCDPSGGALDVTDPITNLGDFLLDYQFEKRVYGDLTAGGTRNTVTALQMPWHFDTDPRGFRSGITAATDSASIADTISEWGEDRNFNNLYDGFCTLGNCTSAKSVGDDPCATDDDCSGQNTCVLRAAGFCTGNTNTQCRVDVDTNGVESSECDANSEGICDTVSCSGINGTQHDACNSSALVEDGAASNSPNGGINLFCFSKAEDRDPQDFDLERSWSTLGGCGWVTQAPGTCTADTNVGCYTAADCSGVDSPGGCAAPGGGEECFTNSDCATGTCDAPDDFIACDDDADCPLNNCNSPAPGGTCTDPAPIFGCNTGAGQSAGGAWHTGRIGPRNITATCMIGGTDLGNANCQLTETVSGDQGLLTWHEILVTPELERVTPTSDMELTWWSWNQAIDLPDINQGFTWEVDNDTSKLNPTDLFIDLGGFNSGFGSYGSVALQNNPNLTNGWSLFAPLSEDRNTSTQGASGTPAGAAGTPLGEVSVSDRSIFARGDRSGVNSCFFENGAVAASETEDSDLDGQPDVLGFPKPPDDDLNNGFCVGNENESCTAFCLGGAEEGKRCSDVAGDTDCSGGDCSATSLFNASCAFDFGTCDIDLIGLCDNSTDLGDGTDNCDDSPNWPNTTCPICVTALNTPPGCTVGVDCTQNPDCPDPNGGGFEVCEADGVPDTCSDGDLDSDGEQDLLAGTGQPVAPCDNDPNDCLKNRCIDTGTDGIPDTCEDSLTACSTITDCSTCTFSNTEIDEYVTAQGPERNMDIQAFNGPDMRFTTLEDIFGVEPGQNWRASVGLINFEKQSAEEDDPEQGYGIGVDDMMMEWREWTLGTDAGQCDVDTSGMGGACATVDLETTNFFEGAGLLAISIWETTPSDNDCDHDGTPEASATDCDSNGIRDVVIEGTSENEVGPGEFLTLNCTPRGSCDDQPDRRCGLDSECEDTDSDGMLCLLVSPTASTCPSGLYQGNLPISSKYNTKGTLFVQSQGVANPTAEILYLDLDDGTGNPCQQDINPITISEVSAFQTIVLTAGNVVIEGVIVIDNGDSDGFVDTNETINMGLIASNKTGVPLTNVTARLATNDPKVSCIVNPTVSLGNMPADNPITPTIDEGRVISADSFQYRVGNVQRFGNCRDGAGTALATCKRQLDCDTAVCATTTSLACTTDQDCDIDSDGSSDELCNGTAVNGTCDADLETFQVGFTVIIDGDDFASTTVPQTVTLDMDLDATGGSGPTSFAEGFNSGSPGDLGLFAALNEDSTLGNSVSADNHHCPFTDPDDPNSFGYGEAECWLGQSGSETTVYWQQSTDRSFEGTGMAFYGVDQGAALGFTTPLGTLESIATVDPVNLGWDRVCATTRTVGCSADCVNQCIGPPSTCTLTGVPCTIAGSDTSECPNEACVPVAPELSFKHQISLVDGTSINASGAARTTGRGIVAAQLADGAGGAASDWIKLVPFVNGYDSQQEDNFGGCTFDPDDDGNTEDTFKIGTETFLQDDFRDPIERKFGPSSTCAGTAPFGVSNLFQFSRLGDTDADFAVTNIGRADGPGLAGTGKGTWVESKVDLSRFRGRRLRVRFTATDAKNTTATWEDEFGFNPDPRDDGWMLDDVRVSDTLTNPATVDVDIKLNTGLAQCPAGICESDAWTAGLTAEDLDNQVFQGLCEDGLTACEDASDCGNGDYCEVTTPKPGSAFVLRGSQFSTCDSGFCTGNGDLNGDGIPNAGDVACSTDLDCGLCAGGLAQFRFWIDVDEDGTAFEQGTDTLLRDWSDADTYISAPTDTAVYQVDVRCSSDNSCFDTTAASPGLRVRPICPVGPNSRGYRPQIEAQSLTDFQGSVYVGPFDYAEGTLATLRAGAYTTTDTGTGSALTTTGHTAWTTGAGCTAATDDCWLLVKPVSGGGPFFCNNSSTYEGQPQGAPATTNRDSNLPPLPGAVP